VDFGNGLLGVYAERSDFHFCVVPEHEQQATREHNREFHADDLDKEDIF
jgi:hypothetical protein